MTTTFFSVLHPTFESLSAYADMPELDAARSRVGRHVARCEDCREIVDDIRRLGDDARGAGGEGAPEGLWSRIASAATAMAEEQANPRETPAPEAPVWEPAPALRPTRHWPIPARNPGHIGLGLLIAAAAAIVAVLVWPTGQSLQATGLSRLTFSPNRPVPGGVLNVRYRPSSGLEGAPRLVLVGKYSQPSGRNALMQWWIRDLVGDSIATLLPTRDGSFEGRLRLPKDFLALQLSVVDSAGEQGDADGWFRWGVIAGEPNGAPSLKAMLAAQETFAETRSDEGAAAHNIRVSVADSLKRYFPSHPAGWAYAKDYGTEKGVFSFLRFFQSAEKRYATFYEKLRPATSLDADRLHDMVVFAFRIEEPAQAEMWAKRLVREHPDDPRALYDLARVLHQVELRQPKDLADSIRPWLPLLDSLYRRAPQPLKDYGQAALLIERYGDAPTKELWRHRFVNAAIAFASGTPSDSAVRALTPAMIQQVRMESAANCIRPAGKFRFAGASSQVVRLCLLQRSNAMRTLAHVALLSGDARAAASFADSAIAVRQPAAYCVHGWVSGRSISARAWLAVGDTVRAEQELMAGIPPANQDTVFTNDARVLLGSRFDVVRWNTAREKAHESYRECQRQAKTESEAEAAKRRARGKL